MTEERCPVCGLEAVGRPGPVYAGTVGILWTKCTFEERLFRCAEGHLYSVRSERRSAGATVTVSPQTTIDDWIELLTGTVPSKRPPGL